MRQDSKQEPESQITCGICMQPVKDPIDLECKHSFCMDCFVAWDVTKNKERDVIAGDSDDAAFHLRLEMPFRDDEIRSIGHVVLAMNGQGLVRCLVCNVTYSAMSLEEYHFLRVYRRVLAKIHYAKLHGYEIMHYIFEPLDIFHYLPNVDTDMYMEPI